MAINVERKSIKFLPDTKKVIARDFTLNTMRTTEIVMRVYNMTDEEAERTINQILRDFSKRHRNITRIFTKHFNKVKHVLKDMEIEVDDLTERKKLLLV